MTTQYLPVDLNYIAYIWQEGGVTAHTTQADEKLQCGSQIVAPLLIVD